MNDTRLDWLRQDITELKNDLRDVKDSVDALNQFKWKVIGSSMAISFILTIAFQILAIITQR